MKLFHLSDLHIGKRVNEFSMLEDQKYILMQILKAAKEHQPDGIILAGDIYDKPVPAAEAVQVFDEPELSVSIFPAKKDLALLGTQMLCLAFPIKRN